MKSAIASLAAATEPAPPMSEYKLEMSLSTPTLTLTCAWATPPASSAARAATPISRFIQHSSVSRSLSCRFRSGSSSDTKVVVKLLQVGFQLGIGEPVDDAAMFH